MICSSVNFDLFMSGPLIGPDSSIRWKRYRGSQHRVNGAGLPMRTEITPGQDSDYTGYDLVMADNLPQPAVLVADRGYDSDKIRADVEGRNALPMIPMRKNRKVRKAVDMTIYTLRNMVERCFNKLKNSRRLATRYDKTADSFLGFIDIACIRLWLRHLST